MLWQALVACTVDTILKKKLTLYFAGLIFIVLALIVPAMMMPTQGQRSGSTIGDEVSTETPNTSDLLQTNSTNPAGWQYFANSGNDETSNPNDLSSILDTSQGYSMLPPESWPESFETSLLQTSGYSVSSGGRNGLAGLALLAAAGSANSAGGYVAGSGGSPGLTSSGSEENSGTNTGTGPRQPVPVHQNEGTPTPEPGTIFLIGSGLIGIRFLKSRCSNK